MKETTIVNNNINKLLNNKKDKLRNFSMTRIISVGAKGLEPAI